MGLVERDKNYILATLGPMLKVFGKEKAVAEVYKKIEEMVNKQDQAELTGTPSTALTDFSKLYFDLFTNMVLPYAVDANDGKNYGEKFQNSMNLIFNVLPKNFVAACEKKNPLEIKDYNTLVKNAFLTKMNEYKENDHSYTYKLVFGNEESGFTKLEELNKITTQFARINASYSSFVEKASNNPNYNKDKETADKLLGALAIKYQDVNEDYKKLNFFQKYFWFTGYKYREEMNRTIEDVRKVNNTFKLYKEDNVIYFDNDKLHNLLLTTAETVKADVNQIKTSAEGFNPKQQIEIDLGDDVEPVKNSFEIENNKEAIVEKTEISIND